MLLLLLAEASGRLTLDFDHGLEDNIDVLYFINYTQVYIKGNIGCIISNVRIAFAPLEVASKN